MVEEAVGERAAELFMKEDERQGDFGSLVGQPVSVAFAVALQQSMRFQFAEIVAKLIETVAVGGEAEGSEEGVVNVFGSPATHRGAAVQQNLHEADHAGVVDFDAGELRGPNGDGQSQALQKRKVDVNIETLSLEASETVRDLKELPPRLLQVAQAFLQPKVGEVIGADFIAQERGELLVLLDEGVFPVRPEDVMPVSDLFQRRVQLSLHLLCDPAAENLGNAGQALSE